MPMMRKNTNGNEEIRLPQQPRLTNPIPPAGIPPGAWLSTPLDPPTMWAITTL